MENSSDASDVEDEFDKSVTSSETSLGPRPNKFQGSRSTWRVLTEDERLVSTSIIQLRNQDISIHLYNAHAMKRSNYDNASASRWKHWTNKDRWRGNKSGEDDESSPNFVPPRVWTAWPLSSDVVPRFGEQIGGEDGAGEWTIKKRESQFPSRVLEEILMGVTLKISRDRFEKREWEGSHENEEESSKKKSVNMNYEFYGIYDGVDEEPSNTGLRDSQPGSLRDSFLAEADEMQSTPNDVNSNSFRGNASHEVGELSNHLLSSEDTQPLPDKAQKGGRPTISVDDERSRRLLRPTVRHTLSKLDVLLTALHNARQTCLYYASEHTESQSDLEGKILTKDDSDNQKPSHLIPSIVPNAPSFEQSTRRSRPGRPPKVLHMPAPSAADIFESVESFKKGRGRKKKIHKPLEGESHAEMLVRIARLQKKALPFTSGPASSASSSPTKSIRRSSQRRSASEHTREKRSARLGLRDWSEILGTASLVGFSPEAIDRAMQRCTALLGEGMTVSNLPENTVSGDEDQIMDYIPGEIPDFNDLENNDTARSESDGFTSPKQGTSDGRKHSEMSLDHYMGVSMSDSETRTLSRGSMSYNCPYTGCSRGSQGFSKRVHLKTHLRNVHKVNKPRLSKAYGSSEEEMAGGVHVDGFMKEVDRKPGWRASNGKSGQPTKSAERLVTEDEE